jgi:hypothetical protein
MNRKQVIIELLSKVLDGQISSSDAMNGWPGIDDPKDDALMKRAWYGLYYYHTDGDIRKREPAYEARQKRDLQNILGELKLSAS